MQNGGAALMGTGMGRGDTRALEAAQQAISSPLLDNVSIAGATGVLINIIGGDDLTLGEVTQINDIIHDAVGDEAEIIFGAGRDAAMHGEVRVTVIATGFDRAVTGTDQGVAGVRGNGTSVLQFPGAGTKRAGPGTMPTPSGGVPRAAPRPPMQTPAAGNSGSGASSSGDMPEMEIPTFIRRQMD
jgi:cell division protein FtsZ